MNFVDLTEIAITFDAGHLIIVDDPDVAAYMDALVAVRRDWQAMVHEGPAPTDAGKEERMAQLSGFIAQAQAAAEVVGAGFTAADYM